MTPNQSFFSVAGGPATASFRGEEWGVEDWLGWVSRERWAVGVGEEPGWGSWRLPRRLQTSFAPRSRLPFCAGCLAHWLKGGKGGVQGRRGAARRTLCLGKARGWLGRTLVRDDSAGKGKQADEDEPPHVVALVPPSGIRNRTRCCRESRVRGGIVDSCPRLPW